MSSDALLLSSLGVMSVNANQIVGITGKTGCIGLNMHDAYYGQISYRKYGLNSKNAGGVDWIMDNRVDATDLNSYPVTSQGADAIYGDGVNTTLCALDWWRPADGGITGLAMCWEKASTGACDSHRVHFENTYTNQSGYKNRRKLVCQGFGHTLGIDHNTRTGSNLNSCTKKLSGSGTSDYSNHEKNDMINFVW